MPTDAVSPPNTTSAVITRLRAWAAAKGWTKSRFAAEAGLRDTTLRGFHHPAWNPTREILERLESVVAAGWQAGDSLPLETAGGESVGAETAAPNAVRGASAAGSGVTPTGSVARPGEAA